MEIEDICLHKFLPNQCFDYFSLLMLKRLFSNLLKNKEKLEDSNYLFTTLEETEKAGAFTVGKPNALCKLITVYRDFCFSLIENKLPSYWLIPNSRPATLVFFNIFYKSWPLYTGNPAYPVPHPETLTPYYQQFVGTYPPDREPMSAEEWIYRAHERNKYTGDYGELRFQLIKYVLTQIDQALLCFNPEVIQTMEIQKGGNSK